MKLPLAVLAATVTLSPALALDNGQWTDQPPEIRAWFQSVMQPDNPAMSCCGEGDAFEVTLDGDDADSFAAIIFNGKGIYPNGAHVSVPRSKLQYKYGNPLPLDPGHYILFIQISNGRPLCLIPGSGT